MDLLKLKDIGKIYVSDNNVTVGIRSVNLTFNRGEFVAITGESGSGKSTLLNVISGMDTYEEGELFINGDATSHYVQNDWEEYRKNYISFIFQNYNIIDSFTVLQNVELALMHIENPTDRRNKALELIERVGMTTHINHKGSKLSGGQKQRTIIARALAKDSPIILADEPTGNLDSKTSKEIIELLHEVSKDKLLIIVTHNFEEVEDYATRHIRVFDGAVEFNKKLRPANLIEDKYKIKDNRSNDLKNGFKLGKTIFFSKPKLSIFLSLLLMIGLLGIFIITSAFGDGFKVNTNYMFTPSDGRVVIARHDGNVITDEELNDLANKYNAINYMHYDLLLDKKTGTNVYYKFMDYNTYIQDVKFELEKDYGKNIIGNYPINDNEVFLYLPISYQTDFGKKEILIDSIYINNCNFKVTGIKYFYDNNLDVEILLTKNGFRYVTASSFLLFNNNGNISLQTEIADKLEAHGFSTFYSSFELAKDKVYVNKISVNQELNNTSKVIISMNYKTFNNNFGTEKEYIFLKEFNNITTEGNYDNELEIIISSYSLMDTVEEVLAKSYRQASLFFESDKIAHNVLDSLKNDGYIAVSSDTKYELDAEEVLFSMIGTIALVAVWLLAIVFIAFFINLCSHKSLQVFKDDISIMRSMGISKNTIKIGMYVRMFISLIPGLIIFVVLSFIIFRSPMLNDLFVYLYAWQYILIVLGMLILIYRITKKQIHRLFNISVKKSLTGGAN